MRFISAIQPTGNGIPHLGNYLGVLKNLPSTLNEDSYVFVADIHATTVPFTSEKIKESIHNTTAMLMACGVNPRLIFQQSQVLEHYILSTILTHITPLSHLERMTQFKSKKEENKLLTGLLTYPVLMAADILLYDIDEVPVGADQIQHIELTRDIAISFNNKFGEIFKIPKYKLNHFSKVSSLTDGTVKMSKSSSSDMGIIYLDDDMKKVAKKYNRAQTDSFNGVSPEGEIRSESVENLISILSSLTGKTRTDICIEYGDRGYGILKKALIEAHDSVISPICAEFKKISQADVEETLRKGSDRAREQASIKFAQIKNGMGL